ncbi:hypothetical protein HK152_02670 [Streptococcus agalactiae]|nr:hypothetical protein [Streptococcus agalactiae]
MANIYARETALKNVVGRSDYISNPKRQEELGLHQQERTHEGEVSARERSSLERAPRLAGKGI